jgi:hypothetical protein
MIVLNVPYDLGDIISKMANMIQNATIYVCMQKKWSYDCF